MTIGPLCAAPDCGKAARKSSPHCSMHQARLRRGGTLERRVKLLTIAETFGQNAQIGHWRIIEEGEPYRRPTTDGKPHPGGVQRQALVECVCGERRLVPFHILRAGKSRHCGCMVSALITVMKTTHGMSHTSEYKSWASLKERCSNPNGQDWPDYGGRGITVCDRWRDSFEAFFADMGRKPTPKHSIDRIDVDGNYEPGNCRWADAVTQANNKRPRKRAA